MSEVDGYYFLMVDSDTESCYMLPSKHCQVGRFEDEKRENLACKLTRESAFSGVERHEFGIWSYFFIDSVSIALPVACSKRHRLDLIKGRGSVPSATGGSCRERATNPPTTRSKFPQPFVVRCFTYRAWILLPMT